MSTPSPPTLIKTDWWRQLVSFSLDELTHSSLCGWDSLVLTLKVSPPRNTLPGRQGQLTIPIRSAAFQENSIISFIIFQTLSLMLSPSCVCRHCFNCKTTQVHGFQNQHFISLLQESEKAKSAEVTNNPTKQRAGNMQ